MSNILAIFFGIAALALTVVTIFLVRRKKPVWAYTTKKIIGLGTDAPAELKLVFNDKQVLEVYKTELIFFNMGNTSIRKDDVSDPIVVDFKGAEFLRDPYAMQIKRHENRLNIINREKSSGSFGIDFLFLDHDDGVIVEIMHTKCEEVECKGNVIDTGQPRYIGKFERRPPEGYKANIITSVVFGGFLIWIGVTSITSMISSSTIDGFELGFLTVFTIGFVFLIILGIKRFYRYFRFPSWSRMDSKKESIM